MPLLYVPQAQPCVSFDNSGISAYQNVAASPDTFTWTQPTTRGAYAIVLLCSSNQANCMTLAATAAVTFGGTTMTSLGNVYQTNTSTQGFGWAFGLANAPGGASVTVSVTLTQAGDTFAGFGSSYTYNNVASVGTLQTAFGNTGAVSVSVPSAAGNLVWAALCNNNSTTFNPPPFTIRQQTTAFGAQWPGFLGGDLPGSATTTPSSTPAVTPTNWCALGLNMNMP